MAAARWATFAAVTPVGAFGGVAALWVQPELGPVGAAPARTAATLAAAGSKWPAAAGVVSEPPLEPQAATQQPPRHHREREQKAPPGTHPEVLAHPLGSRRGQASRVGEQAPDFELEGTEGRFGSPITAASGSCCCSTRATTRPCARNSSAPTGTAPRTSARSRRRSWASPRRASTRTRLHREEPPQRAAARRRGRRGREALRRPRRGLGDQARGVIV